MKNNMKTKVETPKIIFTNNRQKAILETKSKENRLPESIRIKLYED